MNTPNISIEFINIDGIPTFNFITYVCKTTMDLVSFTNYFLTVPNNIPGRLKNIFPSLSFIEFETPDMVQTTSAS